MALIHISCVFFVVYEGAFGKTQPMERLSMTPNARSVWQNSGRCSVLFWSVAWLRLKHVGTLLEEFLGTTTLSNSSGFTMHPWFLPVAIPLADCTRGYELVNLSPKLEVRRAWKCSFSDTGLVGDAGVLEAS